MSYSKYTIGSLVLGTLVPGQRSRGAGLFTYPSRDRVIKTLSAFMTPIGILENLDIQRAWSPIKNGGGGRTLLAAEPSSDAEFDIRREEWNKNPGQVLGEKTNDWTFWLKSHPYISTIQIEKYVKVRCQKSCCRLSKDSSRTFGKLYGIRACCSDYWYDWHRTDRLEKSELPTDDEFKATLSEKYMGYTRLEIETFRWVIMERIGHRMEKISRRIGRKEHFDFVRFKPCDDHIVALLNHVLEDRSEWPFKNVISDSFYQKVCDALVAPGLTEPNTGEEDLDQDNTGKILNYPPEWTLSDFKGKPRSETHPFADTMVSRAGRCLDPEEAQNFYLELLSSILKHGKGYETVIYNIEALHEAIEKYKLDWGKFDVDFSERPVRVVNITPTGEWRYCTTCTEE